MSTSDSELNHAEVLAALREAATAAGVSPESGVRIQADRGTSFIHLGLPTPIRRRRVKDGFSFSVQTDDEVLKAWDDIWWATDVGDVLFAPLDHYRTAPITDVATFWPTVSKWIERIDNWAHADDLARIYSRALEQDQTLVYRTLLAWSESDDEWLQRVSMVSLIKYSGKNASFMPAPLVLQVVANCLADRRKTVTKAAGWVLRETRTADEAPVLAFVDERGGLMASDTKRRALEGFKRQ